MDTEISVYSATISLGNIIIDPLPIYYDYTTSYNIPHWSVKMIMEPVNNDG